MTTDQTELVQAVHVVREQRWRVLNALYVMTAADVQNLEGSTRIAKRLGLSLYDTATAVLQLESEGAVACVGDWHGPQQGSIAPEMIRITTVGVRMVEQRVLEHDGAPGSA